MKKTKFTPGPWRWENTSGAGLQIFGPVPFKADCVEFVLKSSEQPLYTLIAYEQWLQFPPQEWNEMQEANARLIAASPMMFDYIQQKANEGDNHAAQIIQSIIG